MTLSALSTLKTKMSACGYLRPVLCRLCGFPTPDEGVRVSELDKHKLSEWCLRVKGTELDEEGLEEAVICHFCVIDARFEISHAPCPETLPDFGLWDNVGVSKWDTEFSEHLIQPCAVQIVILAPEQIPNNPGSQHQDQKHQCPYCSSSFTAKRTLQRHVFKSHRYISTIRCRFCNSFFKSVIDRKKHTDLNHEKFKSCIYCKKSFRSRGRHYDHMQKVHKNRAIKCSFNNCGLYFLSVSEMGEHVKKVHKKATIKCIYCNKSFSCISEHIYKVHKKEFIRCKFSTCATFFLTKEQYNQHVSINHVGAKEIKSIF